MNVHNNTYFYRYEKKKLSENLGVWVAEIKIADEIMAENVKIISSHFQE
jgi:hypothetical protein